MAYAIFNRHLYSYPNNDNEYFMMNEISKCGWVLEYASDRIKDNWAIVSSAMRTMDRKFDSSNNILYYESPLQFASESIRSDESFMKVAIRFNSSVVKYACKNILCNKEIMMRAVSDDGNMLYHASPELKDDYDVVKAAVCNNWRAIQYASRRLQDHPTIRELALKSDQDAIIRAKEQEERELYVDEAAEYGVYSMDIDKLYDYMKHVKQGQNNDNNNNNNNTVFI